MSKAQIEIQFNWIFVLVIGAILLAFLVTFSFRQQSSADQQVNVQIARQFDTIFTTTLQQPDTVKDYQTPLTDLSFVCNYLESRHSFLINGISARETRYDLFVAPQEFSTRRLYTWAVEWEVPFPIDRFMYITTPQREVIFYQDTPEPSVPLRTLLDAFPSNFTQRVVRDNFANVPTVQSNRDHYTFVFIDGMALPPARTIFQTPADRTTILLVQPNSQRIFESGRVLFLTVQQYENFRNDLLPVAEIEQVSQSYLGKASFFAALFSESRERYTCVMDKALDRLEAVSLVLHASLLEAEPLVSSSCRALLIGTDREGFYGMKYLLEQVNQTVQRGMSPATIRELSTLTSRIDQLNNRVALETNCPLLY